MKSNERSFSFCISKRAVSGRHFSWKWRRGPVLPYPLLVSKFLCFHRSDVRSEQLHTKVWSASTPGALPVVLVCKDSLPFHRQDTANAIMVCQQGIRSLCTHAPTDDRRCLQTLSRVLSLEMFSCHVLRKIWHWFMLSSSHIFYRRPIKNARLQRQQPLFLMFLEHLLKHGTLVEHIASTFGSLLLFVEHLEDPL